MSIKRIIKFCICSFFKLFPIKQNRILFCSYNGREFSCNPRAMYEYLKSLNENFEFVWCINDFSKISDDVTKVKYRSIKYWYYAETSEYFFKNWGFD